MMIGSILVTLQENAVAILFRTSRTGAADPRYPVNVLRGVDRGSRDPPMTVPSKFIALLMKAVTTTWSLTVV